MNKKLEKALDALLKRLQSAEKFVLDQAPLVLKEMILDGYLEQAKVMSFSGLGILNLLIAGAVSYTNWDYVSSGMSFIGFYSIISIVLGLIAMGVFLDAVFTLLQIKLCPKLYLINCIKELLYENED